MSKSKVQKNMKILQINKFYFTKGQAGGAARYFFDLSRLLKERGHQVIPFSMQHPDNLKTSYDKYFVSQLNLTKPRFSWQFVKTAPRVFWSCQAARKLETLIKTEKPDLAHLHNIYHHLSPSILPVLKKYQIPTVMTVHDFNLVCANYSLFSQDAVCRRCQKGKLYHCFLQKCLKDSRWISLAGTLEAYWQKWGKFYQKYIDLFLCPSQFVADELKSFGWPQERIRFLPHFVNEPVGMRRHLVPTNDKYYVYFGRLETAKGLDILIQAASQVPEVKLKIAGSGTEEARFRAQAQDLKNIEFLGWVNRQGLLSLIEGAQFVVVPSITYETFGLSALESFVCARPVIAANHGALPELVKHRQTGLLFESGNVYDLAAKIRYLWSRPQLAQKMGQNAQVLVKEKYNQEIFYQKLSSCYKDAMVSNDKI